MALDQLKEKALHALFQSKKRPVSMLQEAYMSFLLQRHLRLRDLQKSVRIAFLLNL